MTSRSARRLAVAAVSLLALGLLIGVTAGIEPKDLTPLVIALTIGAWCSFVVLARAAFSGPTIGALTERTFIAALLAVLGTVSTILILNSDTGQTAIDRTTAQLIFRTTLVVILAVPTGWLFLWLTGSLGGDDG